MAIYKNYCPIEDATVVHRLREAGAVLLGKLQLTEGAYSDYHPSVTPPKNPWNGRLLARHLLQWFSNGDGSRYVLRIARLRHWRLDPMAFRCQRSNRIEANLGEGLSLRSL